MKIINWLINLLHKDNCKIHIFYDGKEYTRVYGNVIATGYRDNYCGGTIYTMSMLKTKSGKFILFRESNDLISSVYRTIIEVFDSREKLMNYLANNKSVSEAKHLHYLLGGDIKTIE